MDKFDSWKKIIDDLELKSSTLEKYGLDMNELELYLEVDSIPSFWNRPCIVVDGSIIGAEEYCEGVLKCPQKDRDQAPGHVPCSTHSDSSCVVLSSGFEDTFLAGGGSYFATTGPPKYSCPTSREEIIESDQCIVSTMNTLSDNESILPSEIDCIGDFSVDSSLQQ